MGKHNVATDVYVSTDTKLLSATDLVAEVPLDYAEGDVIVALFTINYYPERAQVLYLPLVGRAGIAWGADAQWMDCTSVDDAIERYCNDDVN